MKNFGNNGVQILLGCGSSIVKIIKNQIFYLVNAFISRLPSFHWTPDSKLRNKVGKCCLFLQGYCEVLKYFTVMTFHNAYCTYKFLK